MISFFLFEMYFSQEKVVALGLDTTLCHKYKITDVTA